MVKYNNSSEDKKNRMLQAALEEFAANGYLGTSTNVIAKKANVSKGMIFHVFTSKKMLYMELVNRIYKDLSESLKDCKSTKDDNFFQMYEKYGRGKIRFYSSHPNEYKLMCEAFYNTPKEVQLEIKTLYDSMYSDSYKLIMDKFQKEKLREGVNRQKALEIILSCFGYIGKKYLKQILSEPDYGIKDIEEINDDSIEYLDIIYKGIK